MKMEMSKLFLVGMIASAAFAVNAEVTTFNQPSDYLQSKDIKSLGDNTMEVSKRIILRSKKTFKVEADKTYKFSAQVKASNDKKPWVLFGVYCYDKNNKMILHNNVKYTAGSDTTVVADAKKGDTKIIVKDASKWTKSPNACIALNTKSDLSDLPNRAIVQGVVKNAVKGNGNYTLELVKPLTVNIAANTNIRQHCNGGYLYVGGNKYIAPSWTNMSGTISGDNIWAGTDKIAILFLLNWNNLPDTKVELKNVSIDIQ